MAPHGNRRVGVLKAEPTVAKNRMSRGRLSDCSGSTIGKMEVRVLTHSQAVGSACERRESIACARKGSLRLLLCPGARAREKTRSRSRRRRPRLSSRSEQKRFTGCVMTEECPCSPREATLGASPRRRAAAGRACVSIIPRRTDRARRRRETPKRMSLLLSRFVCITDFETPERNIP